MPEIKNNFTQGRMNKDLDEKLIPKGQYIHALNAQISRAGNSGDGVLGAVKGIELIASSGMSDSICIGSISDEASNKLYFLTTKTGASNNPDCIFEYDQSTNSITTVFRDVNDNVLNFPDDFITAINVIDDFLFWTDGYGEPKKISISRSIEGTPQPPVLSHTQLVVDGISLGDVTHDHVTVIKKKPEAPPTIRIVSSIEDVTLTDANGNVTTINKSINPIFEKIFPRFAVRYKYVDGEYSAIGPFSEVIFKPKFFENRNVDSSYSFKEPYHLAMVNCISSIELANFVPSNIPLDVVQVDLLYMQENSSVVYSIDSIKKIDEEWSLDGIAQSGGNVDYPNVFDYRVTTGASRVLATGRYEVKTENIYAALPENQLLRNYDNVPKLAKAQEITGNRIVYGNYTQNYNIIDNSSQEYTPKLSSTYGLRYNAFETFLEGGLKSIKSQRDYQVGVVFGDNYGRETPVFTSDQSFVTVPWQGSYGLNASQSLLLESSIINGAPSWANYFKFFVKNTAGEYYNLVMDKAYDPPTQTDFENEDDHIWISFASTDRNKVNIDDYIILKKVFDAGNTSSTGQVGVENRFKILDIQNNVPDSISYKYYNLGIARQSDGGTGTFDSFTNSANPFNGTGPTAAALFPQGNQKPDIALNDTIIISRPTWANSHILSPLTGQDGNITAQDFSDNTKGLYISWSASDHPGGTKNSRRYKISSISSDVAGEYKLKLAEVISDDDSLIARPTTAQTVQTSDTGLVMNPTLQVKVERKERRNYENFSGKFFVKIHGDNLIREKIFDFLVGGVPDDYIIGSFNLFRWADGDGLNSGDDATAEVVNPSQASDTQHDNNTTSFHLPSEITTSGSSISNTEQDWQELLDNGFNAVGGFIVDEMYLAGSNPHNNSYAKHAGQGWHGADHIYPEQVWRPVAVRGSTGSGVNGFPDFGPAYEGQGTQSTSINIGNIYGASEGYAGTAVISTNDTTSIANLNNAPAANAGNLVSHWNAMEGAIETDNEHTTTAGSRRWLDGNQDGLNTTNLDNTYGTTNGRNIVHISFVAPGRDLHNGDGLTTGNIPNNYYFRGSGTEPTYDDVLSVRMQGIWGGGWFSSGSKFGTSSEGFVCFEGNWGPTDTHGYNFGSNYDSEQAGWFQTPAPGQCGVNNNQGYNLAFQQDHEDQWKPNKTTDNALNAIAEEFLNTMVPGARFRFKDDPDAEVYTILSRKEKHLYNHTPWRQRWVYDGSNFVAGGDSVEEAAIAWANTTTDPSSVGYWRYSGTTSSFIGEWYYGGKVTFPDNFAKAATSGLEWDTLAQRIVDFGKANNRRTCYIFEFDKDIRTVPTGNTFNAYSTDGFDVNDFLNVEIISDNPQVITGEINENPAIWETEPSQNDELNIYHEVSGNIPLRITADNFELLAPTGCRVEFPNLAAADPGFSLYVESHTIVGNAGVFNVRDIQGDAVNTGFNFLSLAAYADQEVRFYKDDGSYATAIIDGTWLDSNWDNASNNFLWSGLGYRPQFRIKLDIDPSKKFGLSYYNTFAFGDGVESSRVRAGFNEMKLTNGPKASATLEQPYQEEERKNGLIYSGIYNSTSGVNNLNQFISAEKITKDINPTYGGITKLFSRKTDLITLCEDRILKVLANKDAVFNADGNPQLVASGNVLGQAVPFAGDYGCQNPESVDFDNYRIYFADKQRRSVLRLSMDGLTPISDAGMRSWFQENLVGDFVLGTYDNDEEEYNLTIGDQNLVNLSTDYIQNSYFSYGDDFYTVETTPDFTEDGALNNGNSLSYGTATGVQENLDLSAEVIVINWPAIPQGSVFSAVTAVNQNSIPAQFNDNISNPTSNYLDYNIYSAFNEGVRDTSFAQSVSGSFNDNEVTDNQAVYNPSNTPFYDFKGSPFNGSVGHGTPVTQLKRQITFNGTTTYLSAGVGNGISSGSGINSVPSYGDLITNSYALYENETAINTRCADSRTDRLDQNPSDMQTIENLGNFNNVHRMMKPNIFWDFGEVDNSGDHAGDQGIIFQGYRDCQLHLSLPGNHLYGGSTAPQQKRRNLTAAIRNWHTQTNPIPSLNTTGYYNLNGVDYQTADNNTIFHGEIVEIEFEVGYPSFIDNENFDQEPLITVELYDGHPSGSGTLVDSSNIYGYTGNSNIPNFFGTMGNILGVTEAEAMFDVSGIPPGQTLSYNYTNSDTEFTTFPAMGQYNFSMNIDSSSFSNLSAFRKTFKARIPFISHDGNGTIQSANQGSVVVDNLQVRITVDGTSFTQQLDTFFMPISGSQMSSTLILRNFRMRKLYQMIVPPVPEYIVLGQADFPEQDIPEWAQVCPIQGTQIYSSNGDLVQMEYPAYGDQNKWTDVSTGAGFKKVWQNIGFNAYSAHNTEYGDFNYPTLITGTDANGVTHSIFAGENNGTTSFGDYNTPNPIGGIGYGGNNIASTLSSNAPSPTYAINPVSISTKIEKGTYESLPSLIYPLNINLIADNWYAIRSTTTNAPTVAPSSTNHVSLFMLKQVADPTANSFPAGSFRNHTQSNTNYPDWHYGNIPSASHPDFNVGDIGLAATPNFNFPTGPMTRYMSIFKYHGTGTPGELHIQAGYAGNILGETIETIEVRNLTTYNNGGGDATNWTHINEPTSFAGIPGQIDFLLANTNPAIVTWPFHTYFYNSRLCWRTTNQYQDWYQEFGSAQNSNVAPQNPSIGGYAFRFKIGPDPLSNGFFGDLRVSVANALGDWDTGECAGFYLADITQGGSYEIIFNFDNSHAPQVFLDGQDITSTSNTSNLHNWQGGFQSNSTIANKIRFVSGPNGATMSVRDIEIEDLTIAFGGGTATSWNFTGFNTQLQNYITWNNNAGNISLNNLPYPVPVDPIHNPNGDPYQIEQVISPAVPIDASQSYYLTADVNIEAHDSNGNLITFDQFTPDCAGHPGLVYPELTFYYYDNNGEGFHFSPGQHLHPGSANLIYNGANFQPWWLSNGYTGGGHYGTPNNLPSQGYKIRIPFGAPNTTLYGPFWQQFQGTGAHPLMSVYGVTCNPYDLLSQNPTPNNILIQSNQCGPLLQNTFVIVINGIANSPTESYTISGTIDNVRLQSFDILDTSSFQTLSYKEQQKGWVSFKNFYPENGLSLGSSYYTFKGSDLYKHHATDNWNQFHGGSQFETQVRLVFNDSPSICKEFHSINFEGSIGFNGFSDDNTNATDFAADGFLTANSHFSQVLNSNIGWKVQGNLITDMERGTAMDFDKKENKWYSGITGIKNPLFYQTDKTTVQGNDQNNSFGIGIVESSFEDDGTNDNLPDPNADTFDEEAEENEALENIPPPQQNIPQQNVPQQSPPPATPPPSSPAPSGGGSSGGGY